MEIIFGPVHKIGRDWVCNKVHNILITTYKYYVFRILNSISHKVLSIIKIIKSYEISIRVTIKVSRTNISTISVSFFRTGLSQIFY
jgi:presenilin-like A22 family membrane protease